MSYPAACTQDGCEDECYRGTPLVDGDDVVIEVPVGFACETFNGGAPCECESPDDETCELPEADYIYELVAERPSYQFVMGDGDVVPIIDIDVTGI